MPRLDPERAAKIAYTPSPKLTPTDEQTRILDAYATGDDLVIAAGAGTGKTSTLRMLAESDEVRRGIYVAYNKAIADDAKAAFPSSVRCATAHSFAFRATGQRYAHRLSSPRVPAYQAARHLGIVDGEWLPALLASDRVWLGPPVLARLALQMVDRFCYSDSEQLEATHAPRVEGLSWEGQTQLGHLLLPHALAAWADLTQLSGRLKFQHDHYLKLWQLSHPKLECDFILLDEAQDANPVVDAIFREQGHAQRIMVGDENQAIYQWRGAIDAMSKFKGRRLQLSQSFRFGQAIADEANKWLSILGSELRLTGRADLDSTTTSLTDADAILCRSNAGAVEHVLVSKAAQKRVALVGGGHDIRNLAIAAAELQHGNGTTHPELFLFSTWHEVREYADDAGADLKTFVKLIDRYTPEGVLQALDNLVEESEAEVIVSTAHKAKGREWGAVRIAGDFYEPGDDETPRSDECRLAYVAVTRAKLQLDRFGLTWIDRFVKGGVR